MHNYLELLQQIQQVAPGKPFVVVVTGKMSAGKSSLINSLLSRPGLAESSSGGDACTRFMTRFVHRDSNLDATDSKTSGIHVHYLNTESIREVLSRALDDFSRYEHELFSLDDSEVEVAGYKIAWNAAKNIFAIISTSFPSKIMEPWEHLLIHERIEHGEALQDLVARTERRISEAGAENTGSSHFQNVKDIELARTRARANALWPIIQLMDIATSDRLVNNNIVLVDVPGLGDSNHVRATAIDKMRRYADLELIVTDPARTTDNNELRRQLDDSIRAHGINKIVLIVNKNDDITNNENFWDENISP
ncbi:hypothetical protein EJ04DRAFT_219923 [Polyplosphaeria fusca]|uniref:Dynamin N-terminal domain-containing protein n=1 Tax=Polyplosphaeria fusca TaxID=682080 RepID=A0A9P4V207_9PLEO|nr:hypothetical protein EJ04DRAFT_219923 [Polyplosphaeria fusca]